MRALGIVFAATLSGPASLAILITAERSAHACGVSGSGTTGLCDASAAIDEKRAATRDRYGLSYGFTSSVLYFSDGFRAPTERHVVMLSYEHPLPTHWTFSANAGVLLGGTLASATFRPGAIGAVSLSHLIAPPGAGYASPFLLSTFTLAGMYAQTTLPAPNQGAYLDYTAFDFSFEMTAGVAMHVGSSSSATTLTPFLNGRLFGGPVFYTSFWSTPGGAEAVLGTDAYKYALGPGLALSLFRHQLALSIAGSVLGERNLRFGASVSF